MNSSLRVIENFRDLIRPENIFEEVKIIISLIFPDFNYDLLSDAYADVIKLFDGKYSGYQKCDTGYHDIHHTEECFLEMARLIHGTTLNGYSFSEKEVNLGLISAIMHDTGYIKEENDIVGTGGKYTLIHITRSIDFLRDYLSQKQVSPRDIQFCVNCLKCTGFMVKIDEIEFVSSENEIMGKILGTADLLGQMANPSYLEKLPSLFVEFHEAGFDMYKDEFDLIQKTPDFWEFSKDRFATELGNVDRYLQDHFRVRWGIDRDLDREAIEENINTLKYILAEHQADYRRYLKR